MNLIHQGIDWSITYNSATGLYLITEQEEHFPVTAERIVLELFGWMSHEIVACSNDQKVIRDYGVGIAKLKLHAAIPSIAAIALRNVTDQARSKR